VTNVCLRSRSADLELEFNSGARLRNVHAAESLQMRVQTASGDLGVAALYGVDECVVDEDVLVLGLHHVVALRAETRHVTVHVERPLVFGALQHRVDDDHRSSATHSGAVVSHTHIHTQHTIDNRIYHVRKL